VILLIKKIFEGLSNNEVIHKKGNSPILKWGKSSKTRFEHENLQIYLHKEKKKYGATLFSIKMEG
jgi:hypothetical protein